MKLKLFLFFPLTILSYTDQSIISENLESEEQSYNIAKNFIEAVLESNHQENPDKTEDPRITEFQLALRLFGEFSKNGNFVSMNKIIIWLEKNIGKFKEDFSQENLSKEIYYPTLNEIGLSCAVGAIVYEQKNSKNIDSEEIEYNIKQLDRVLAKYLKLLINNGADINHFVNYAKPFVSADSQWNKINGSLLHIAASTNRDDLITLLISLKADPNLRDTNKRIALHIAIENCKDDQAPYVIEAIIENGCDVNAEYAGVKPLKLAVYKRLMHVAHLLIQKGANQKTETKNSSNAGSIFSGFWG